VAAAFPDPPRRHPGWQVIGDAIKQPLPSREWIDLLSLTIQPRGDGMSAPGYAWLGDFRALQ